MRAVLLTLGPVQIKTINIFLVIGLLAGVFIFWRRNKYDSYYDEFEAVDGFLWSLLMGYLIGRVVFILLNLSTFGLNPLNWINIFTYPGMNELTALIGSGLVMWRWSKRHKFEAGQMLDYWATAASLTLAIYQLGYLVAGLGYGHETNLPWGIVFPDTLTPRQPVPLYLALFFTGLFIFLNWAENKYRTFDWYRNGRSSAESGFLAAMFMILVSAMNLGMLFLRPSQMQIADISLDAIINSCALVFGLGFLWIRSGRGPGNKKAGRKVKRQALARKEQAKLDQKQAKKAGGDLTEKLDDDKVIKL